MKTAIPGSVIVVLAGLHVTGCTGDSPCASSSERCELEATLSEVTIEPGQEIVDRCLSWTLNNPEELWVSSVAMQNSGGYHHSNWFFVPDHQFVVPDGAWSCNEHDFTELGAALLGGFLFAQSTQSQDEAQTFAPGAAVRVPPYSRVIGSVHLLNASDQPMTTRMSLRIATLPPHEVTARLVPARIEYRDLTIPPGQRAEFTAGCDIATEYQDLMGKPLELELHYVLPHYHQLGTYIEYQLLGGERDGEVVYRHEGYGDNFGHVFDPPIDLAALGATGIRFTCGYMNPRAEEVGWGIGDQEMCSTAIFADTPMAFEADVEEGTGEVIGSREDGTLMYTGPCQILGLPWDHDKPGGMPR